MEKAWRKPNGPRSGRFSHKSNLFIEADLANELLIKNIRYLLTMAGDPLDHSAGSAILIKGNQVVGIYPPGTVLPLADRIIDGSKHLIMPGLINCHHHFYQTLTRNLPRAANAKLFDWLLYLYDIWAAMTPKVLRPLPPSSYC